MRTKQLYYKEGRRYREFIPPREVTDTLYYLDADGEYVPLCEETMTIYNGRLSDGVWLVRDGCTKARRIGDFNTSSSRIAVEEHRDLILKAINYAFEKSNNQYISADDIATYMFDYIAPRIKTESGTFDENVILYYVNWHNKQTGRAPTNEQLENFKKDSLEMIKIYVKKGYDLKDAFNKVINGYNR